MEVFSNLFLIIYLVVGVLLLVANLFFVKAKTYRLIKYLLLVYQFFAGIIVGIIFILVEKLLTNFMMEVLSFSILLLNTLSLIIFINKNRKVRKEIDSDYSILAFLAIICGVIFIAILAYVLYQHNRTGYRKDVKIIVDTGKYDRVEAEELLENLYDALKEDKNSKDCLSLYGMWSTNKKDVYSINIEEVCDVMFLPPNSLKMVVNRKNKTKIEEIYWQFNEDIRIMYYEDGKQVDNYKYLYNASLYDVEPEDEIKKAFEKEVKEELNLSKSLEFDYEFNYMPETGLFMYKGKVYMYNEKGIKTTKKFDLNILPCEKKNCFSNNMRYTWEFTD